MPPEVAPVSATIAPSAASIGPLALFLAFSRMALSGFGGVLPFAYRALVERLRWVSAAEFAELLALGQVLPGPTICNVSLMVGYRKGGLSGAVASLAGMLGIPMLIVLALGAAWQHYGEIPRVHSALSGMSSVAAGLIVATGIKMGLAVFGPARGTPRFWTHALFAAIAFIGIGLLHWPMVAVVGVVAPISVLLAYREER
jgi:chromate transporter